MDVDLALTLPIFIHKTLNPLLKLIEAVLVSTERIRPIASPVRWTEIVHELHVLRKRRKVRISQGGVIIVTWIVLAEL